MIIEVGPGVRLSVTDRGPRSAPALVLLHGWGTGAAWWDPVADRLADRLRVIVPDQRMHGVSLDLARDRASSVSIAALAADVFAVLAALGVERAVLVGHSMGGQVAAVAADREPERVLGTIVADPAYGAGAEEIAAAPTRMAAHVATVRDRRTDRADRELEALHEAALVELYHSEYLHHDAVGGRAATAPLLLRRKRPALAVYSTEAAAAVERELSRGASVPPEVVVWPGRSHDFPVEEPAAFSDLVLDWTGRRTRRH